MKNVIGVGVTRNGIISKFDGNIQIFSIAGKLIMKTLISNGQEVKLSSGIYIVCLSTSEGDIIQKVVL